MMKSVRAIIDFNSNLIVTIFTKLIDHVLFCSDCCQQIFVVFMLVAVALTAPHPEAKPEAKSAIAYAYNPYLGVPSTYAAAGYPYYSAGYPYYASAYTYNAPYAYNSPLATYL